MKEMKIGYEYPENVFKAAFDYLGNNEEFNKYFSNDDKEFKMIEILSSTKITDRERDMIKKYFNDGLTITAIAKEYSLTRERIRQLLNKSLAKIYRTVKVVDVRPRLTNDSTIKDMMILGLINSRTYNSITRYGKINTDLTVVELKDLIDNEEINKFRNLGPLSIEKLKEVIYLV